MRRRYLAIMLMASAGFPAVAQGQAVSAAPAAAPVAAAPVAAPVSAPVDPARLAAARALIDLLMPPATRAQMIESMMTPMLANIRQGMTQNPDFVKAMGDDPRVKTLFDQFMARQQAQTMSLMRTSLPGMADALARAYARRFDVAQMRDLTAFFMTPTGRAYTQQSYTIMSDPDIGAWQRTMMTESMGHMQSDIADFAKRVAALHETKPEKKK